MGVKQHQGDKTTEQGGSGEVEDDEWVSVSIYSNNSH